MKTYLTGLLLLIFFSCSQGQPPAQNNLQSNFIKMERMIPMRDGIKLFTAIYVPVDTSGHYPILMERTPYSCAPYGEKNYRRRLGPSSLFAAEKYIYVVQDVRGRYMSEGSFREMTPAITDNNKGATDESSDTYDTIDWLLHNLSYNNGRVGMYGISYPGFYASAALPRAHPALKAVSPQAPVTDEFEGDDAYHRGAFFLMDNHSFLNFFDHPREQPWQKYPFICNLNITDAYDYYLKMGPLKNINATCFNNTSKIWNEYLEHDTKDDYWQKRDIRSALKDVKPAVLVVGGFFDAEDMFGALETYRAIEQQNPGNNSHLIMGPWTHGAWARSIWTNFGSMAFGPNPNAYYQKKEFDFFNNLLKGDGSNTSAEATIFETGTNTWKEYDQWPPKEVKSATWYLNNNRQLSFTKPASATGSDQYISDPADPVPYIDRKAGERIDEYMIADQSFASKRADVLSYESAVLENDVTLSGPITADLFVSMTGTDADFIVKVIDVLPDTAAGNGGMQRLVRAEILRGKFRNSFVKPEAFAVNKVTPVKLQLNDVAHCFKKGHKIMVQVQSSWFPLVDRNPQKFMRIPLAEEKDFQKSTIKIYHSSQYPSTIKVLQM